MQSDASPDHRIERIFGIGDLLSGLIHTLPDFLLVSGFHFVRNQLSPDQMPESNSVICPGPHRTRAAGSRVTFRNPAPRIALGQSEVRLGTPGPAGRSPLVAAAGLLEQNPLLRVP